MSFPDHKLDCITPIDYMAVYPNQWFSPGQCWRTWHIVLLGYPFPLFTLTIFLLISSLSPDIYNTFGSVPVYNFILVLPPWDYIPRQTSLKFGCEMVNQTIILDSISVVLKEWSYFSHLQVLEGHLTIVAMKHLSIHKESLCWQTSGHAQMVACRFGWYYIGSLSVRIKKKVPVVTKHESRIKRTEPKCN